MTASFKYKRSAEKITLIEATKNSLDISVIVTGSRIIGCGFNSWEGRNFLFATKSRPDLGSLTLLSNVYRACSRVKRPGREAKHSSASTVEVKMHQGISPILVFS
jgi:hypothetical protein